jgi:hypothetical protein
MLEEKQESETHRSLAQRSEVKWNDRITKKTLNNSGWLIGLSGI